MLKDILDALALVAALGVLILLLAAGAVADYMAEGWRCFECNAPLGHSRSCSHFDGYTPDEMQEHLEDSEV